MCDGNITIPGGENMSRGELYWSMYSGSGCDVLEDWILAAMTKYFRYRYDLAKANGMTRSWWYRFPLPPEGVTKADFQRMWAIRAMADVNNKTFGEIFRGTWLGENRPGGALENIVKARFQMMHTAARAHSPQMLAVARWVYENRRYRYDVHWGHQLFYDDVFRIANEKRNPPKKGSVDESIALSASRKAKALLQRFPLKNKDWGFALRCFCSDLMGVHEDEDYATFKGSGYCHSIIIEAGRRYYQGGIYSYYHKPTDVVLSILTRITDFNGLGIEIGLDN